MAVSGEFTDGHKTTLVFDFIEFDRYIIDELHSRLRIVDKLLTLLIEQLTDHAQDKSFQERDTSMKKRLQDAMQAMKVKFKYYINRSGEFFWTCLYGCDRLRGLKN